MIQGHGKAVSLFFLITIAVPFEDASQHLHLHAHLPRVQVPGSAGEDGGKSNDHLHHYIPMLVLPVLSA